MGEKAEISLEVLKDALTEERAEEYKEQYDEGWDKEGYLITGDITIEEVVVEDILTPEISITAHNNEIYIRLVIPLDIFLTELLKRNAFREMVSILEEQKAEIEKIVLELKKTDSCTKKMIVEHLVRDSLKEGGD